MRYGRLYLMWGAYRTFPFKSVNWVTRDSNRLVNLTARYQAVRDELDVAKNEEQLKIPLNDVRWNDHRKLHFVCGTCGQPYRKHVSSMTKYHSMCGRCSNKYPSVVLGAQSAENTPSLAQSHPDLCKQLACPKPENIQKFSNSSKFVTQWKCSKCNSSFEASIRTRTGLTFPGESDMHPLAVKAHQFCETCRWAELMTNIGTKVVAEGAGYTGLEASMVETFPQLPVDRASNVKKRKELRGGK
jgi:DNA-directed RNA polymerase subunit RPC12/RpoP